MGTWQARTLVALALVGCAGAGSGVGAPVAMTVDLPRPGEDLPPPPSASSAAAGPACPPDTLAENGQCVRVVASPEIPTWHPPAGHGDPCSTWTSDKGLVDCDWKNELPADGGR
jgi:hypothetical protein